MEKINVNLAEPNLSVVDNNDAGVINIGKEIGGAKSVNFGPGVEMLMNPNRSKSPSSTKLKSDIELTKFTKLSDELYQFNIGELTKEGRWNIYINAMVNDKVGYLSYRADTRENVKYTKPQVITY